MVNKSIELGKDILNELENTGSRCVECGACVRQCEMLQHFCKSPRELFKNAAEKKSMDLYIPYSCSLCGVCKLVCPEDLDLGHVFINMRKYAVKNNDGASPMKGHSSVHMHQNLSFSSLLSGILGSGSGKKIKRLFMPGCSLCAYNPELVFKTFEYLKKDSAETAMIVECCGKPSKIIGEEEAFSERIAKLRKMADSSGASEIVTACQSCFLLLKECGLDQNIISLWNLLAKIGLPQESKGVGRGSDIVFSIQDSCVTRYREDIQNSVRYIVEQLGYKVEESLHYGRYAHCCGTGGMISTTSPDISGKVMKDTASFSSTDYVLTYCASCRESMSTGGKKSLHILDLIFGGRWDSHRKIPGRTSLYRNWLNRYKVMRGGYRI